MSRPRHRTPLPEPSEPIEVELTDAAFGGDAVGRLPDGRVVFASRGLPGETALVRLYEERKDYARAEVSSVLRAAPGRTEPPCPYYLAGCGGCSWQHATYATQLALKRAIVVEQLRRVGQFANADALVQPAIGMVEPWHYRNQARFTVGRKFGELCFTYRASHRLLRVDHCWIVHPAIDATLGVLQGRLAGVERRIHQVAIRVGANTGDVLVSPELPEVPEVASGQKFLTEEVLTRRYRMHASAFFQVNTRREARPVPASVRQVQVPLPEAGLSMADILALLVLDRAAPARSDVVVDAYGGVGTFALLLAPLVAEVVGIEEARVAVADAKVNGADVPNVRFVEARTEVALSDVARERRPDVVVLDPARAGAHPAVLETLLAKVVRPRRIVYVSCDPSTLARDLKVLVAGGYHLDDVQPVDMFPQTYHVECVATLTR